MFFVAIEATPVPWKHFSRARSSTNVALLLGSYDFFSEEGSGRREKRSDNLEDFLLWMPSGTCLFHLFCLYFTIYKYKMIFEMAGDGQVEEWHHPSRDLSWFQKTTTVYVTETVYATVSNHALPSVSGYISCTEDAMHSKNFTADDISNTLIWSPLQNDYPVKSNNTNILPTVSEVKVGQQMTKQKSRAYPPTLT